MNTFKKQLGWFMAGALALVLVGFTIAEGIRIKPQAGLGQPSVGAVLFDADGTGMGAWSNLNYRYVGGITEAAVPFGGPDGYLKVDGSNFKYLSGSTTLLSPSLELSANGSAGGLFGSSSNHASRFIATNAFVSLYTLELIPTNDASRLINLNFDQASRRIRFTNDIVFTNLSGFVEGQDRSSKILLEPTLINRTVTYPAFDAASFGAYNRTNPNNTLFTTLTNGRVYVLSVEAIGTNLFWTISSW